MSISNLIESVERTDELDPVDKNEIIALIRERARSTLDGPDGDQESISNWHNPLPEGVVLEDLSSVAQASYNAWKKLDPEKQKNVTYVYVQEDGAWEIRIGNLQMQLTSATAEADPSNGIFVHHVQGEDRAYFTQIAAIQHAQQQWMKLPTNDQWKQMVELLGWYNQLRDVLQIPLVSYYDPTEGHLDSHCVDQYVKLWSAGSGDALYVDDSMGYVRPCENVQYGYAIRLLRDISSDT